jgi:hypothetical protein
VSVPLLIEKKKEFAPVMKKKSFRLRFLIFSTVFCLFAGAPTQAQPVKSPEKFTGNLYEQFKAAELLPCGKRAEAVRLAQLILEQYQLAENFAASFKTRLAVLEEEEAKISGRITAGVPNSPEIAVRSAGGSRTAGKVAYLKI